MSRQGCRLINQPSLPAKYGGQGIQGLWLQRQNQGRGLQRSHDAAGAWEIPIEIRSRKRHYEGMLRMFAMKIADRFPAALRMQCNQRLAVLTRVFSQAAAGNGWERISAPGSPYLHDIIYRSD